MPPRRIYKISTLIDMLNTVHEIKESIIWDNVLKTDVLRVFGESGLSSSIYQRTVDLFQYVFRVKDGSDIHAKLSSCLTSLQSIWDKAATSNTYQLTQLKNYHFITLKGFFSKLYASINPFTNEIAVKSRDASQLIKLFSGIETTLSTLASIEIALFPEQGKDVYVEYSRLSQEDQILFVCKNWMAQFITQLDDKMIMDSLRYILADSQIKLKPSELLSMFDRCNEQERLNFVKLLFNNILPTEKRAILDILNGQPPQLT